MNHHSINPTKIALLHDNDATFPESVLRPVPTIFMQTLSPFLPFFVITKGLPLSVSIPISAFYYSGEHTLLRLRRRANGSTSHIHRFTATQSRRTRPYLIAERRKAKQKSPVPACGRNYAMFTTFINKLPQLQAKTTSNNHIAPDDSPSWRRRRLTQNTVRQTCRIHGAFTGYF